MRRLKSVLGYAWALATVPIVLATFVGMHSWARGFAGLTGLEVSPWYTGGKSAYTITHDGYVTTVNEPVFQGLLWETKRGFVQVKWTPDAGVTLPDRLEDSADFDGDGVSDFSVSMDTRSDRANIEALNPLVVGVREVINLDSERAVRINVLNPNQR